MRRITLGAVASLFLAAAPAQAVAPTSHDEAEQLLRQMDAKIVAAKSLRIEFEVRLPRRQNWNGSVLPEETIAGSLVLGDVSGSGKVTPQFHVLPDWHNELLRSWIGRGGTLLAMAQVESIVQKPAGKQPGPEHAPQVSKVRLLPDEKFNGARCRVVGYDLAWPDSAYPPGRAKV